MIFSLAGLEPARLGVLLQDPERILSCLTRTILKNLKAILKIGRAKSHSALITILEGERALENWKFETQVWL